MSVNDFRKVLYGLAKFLGDVQALSKGRAGKRIARRTAGKAAGKTFKRIFK